MSRIIFQIFLLQSLCSRFQSRLHLPRSFAAFDPKICCICCHFQIECSVSFSSSSRNSLISSSHILLGLPIVLYVLYLELSSRFHSATFTIHLSLGRDAILSASLHFVLS